MKISLIQPSGIIYRNDGGIFPRVLRYAPSTLVTLAGLVPSDLEAEIDIVDEGVHTINLDVKPDLVGISTITGTTNRGYAIARHFRDKGIPVVMGGVHPTLMPEEAKQHADAIVTGLAFESWPQLLRDFKSGNLKEHYRETPNLSLSNLPIPRKDLIRPLLYRTKVGVQATFGCPYTCDFCAVVATQSKYRHRPVADVISEIESTRSPFVVFVDPSPTEDKKYIRDLWSAMVPLKKNWFGLTTVRAARDNDLMDLAAKSGCRGVLIGFETVYQEGINMISKAPVNKVETYKEVVKGLHDKGIAINGTFMFGLDTDDADVFKRTVDFVQETNIDLPRYAIITPFPGTPLFNRLEREGRILTKNWTLYDAQHCVFQPSKLSPSQLEEGEIWAWEQTYKIGSIVKRVFGSGCSPIMSLAANLGYRYYGNRLRDYSVESMLKIEKEWNPKSNGGRLEEIVSNQPQVIDKNNGRYSLPVLK